MCSSCFCLPLEIQNFLRSFNVNLITWMIYERPINRREADLTDSPHLPVKKKAPACVEQLTLDHKHAQLKTYITVA